MENMENSQIITIGANKKATFWVPQCWRANSPINMTQAINTSSPASPIYEETSFMTTFDSFKKENKNANERNTSG